MICTMFFHGGSSYASFDVSSADDAERFSGIKAARDEFESRVNGNRSRFPCVDESAEAWIFFGEFDDIRGDYPDRIIKVGPRGGIIVEVA